MITERAITAAGVDRAALRELYESAFPTEEQIPWADLMRLVDTMHHDFTAYYDEDALIGFTIVYPRRAFNWFWYFAVPEPLRGKGVGQRIFSRLLEKYSRHTNILDMESPEQVCDNAPLRRRQHDFYLRNGFRDTGVGRSFGGIDYTIMIIVEGTFTMRDYDDLIDELRSFWIAMPRDEE